jgi:hypothetical protein
LLVLFKTNLWFIILWEVVYINPSDNEHENMRCITSYICFAHVASAIRVTASVVADVHISTLLMN